MTTDSSFSLTIRVTKLTKGYMADLKQVPEIMVYSPTKKGLITKLFSCIAGYEKAFPNGMEKKLLDR